ncbi:MAG TPA: hypothetical protein DCY48_03425 [Candidatus Magasanikbacteria bacterium]|nr:hypothetical protein [Candidatus Magasanikbacteria bacterium]
MEDTNRCRMKTIAVIPAYNEAKHIAEIVSEVKKYVPDVLVIDDASADATRELAKRAGATVLRHPINLGKAGAIKTGCDAALSLQAEIIILLDGDGQHDPKHIPEFLAALDEQTDIVFGSRNDLNSMPFVRRLGTKMLEISMKRLFHVNILDMQCGYRAFRTRVYALLQWNSNNYHADAEITARVGKNNLRYKEIFIDTIYHDSYKGMTIIDGLTLLGKIFIWKLTL